MRKTLLVLALLLPPTAAVELKAAGQVRREQLRQSVFSVAGMSCAGCATGIESMLKRTQGVRHVAVSYDKAEARISYDGTRTNETKLIDVITKLGYKVKTKKS